MKLKVEVPTPPPMTFKLELTEEEASILVCVLGAIDGNDNPETKAMYEIREHLSEHLFDSAIYSKVKARCRPNGRFEIGTYVPNPDVDW